MCIERIKRGLFEQHQPTPNQWRLQLAKHARTRLAESYQPVIVHLAKSFAYSHRTFEMGDFVNEGTIGLLTLLDKLDVYEDVTGASLSGLAFAYIRGAMLNLLRYHHGLVCLSDRVLRALKQLRQVKESLCEALQREPSYHEIAQEMQLSVEKVLELVEYQKRQQVESLDGLLEDGDALEHLSFMSLFEAQAQADRERASQMNTMIEEAMATELTSWQREVVRLRYGFDTGPCKVRTNETVGSLLGVGAHAVHSTDYRARERLRAALAPVVAASDGEWSA